MIGLALCGCSEEGLDTQPTPPGEPHAQTASTDAPPEERSAIGPDGWAEQHPIVSPNAQPELHWAALAERDRERDPADGAGRAWIERTQRIEAGSHQRIELVFEVADSGIAEGGLIFVQADPFWSWSEAQTIDRTRSGYTTASPRQPGIELVPSNLHIGAFEVRGRALKGGEKIDFVYGAGPSGARVDDYAERGAPLLIGVDATGNGTRAWLSEPASLDISARDAESLVAFAAADIAPGQAFEISLAPIDGKGNRTTWPGQPREQNPSQKHEAGSGGCENFAFAVNPIRGSALLDLPDHLELNNACARNTRQTLRLIAPNKEGVLRLEVTGLGELASMRAEVNPIVVRHADRRLVWGDLHGHSQLSDGTGTPEDYFRYARDVARLDAVALTDHDHWGIRPLDEHPELIEAVRAATNEVNVPGDFITLPGYEWTNWVHGHRHVLSFDDALPFFSALDSQTDRPDELWAALRGQPVLTFAHHSAGEPVATNWAFRPDPILEPVTEIVSVHGMSEARDAPAPVRGGIDGYFVRDTLLRGDRLGFIGSGDSHDGHPGLTQIAGGQGGLAGLITEALDRPALLETLRRRQTFATNGIRPFLEVHLDEVPMGGSLSVPIRRGGNGEIEHESGLTKHPELRLHIRYEATSPVKRIDLIRSGRIAQIPIENEISLDLVRMIPALRPGDFHYVRIVEEGGGTAWSSPIFVDAMPGS